MEDLKVLKENYMLAKGAYEGPSEAFNSVSEQLKEKLEVCSPVIDV